MNDLGKFAAQCRAFGPSIRDMQRRAVQRSALGMTETIRGQIRAAVPDMGVKGFRGRKQVKVGAGYRIKSGASGAYAIVSARGPLQLIEHDTRAHTIPKQVAAKGTKKRARQGRAGGLGRRHVLLIPGIGFRRVVHHPGTHGKHPFRKGVEAYRPQVPKVFADETRKTMVKVFHA